MSGFPLVNGYTAGKSGIYIPTIWASIMLGSFFETSVVPYISNTDYEGEIKAFGDKVTIGKVPKVTVKKYEIGAELEYDELTPSSIDLEINQGDYYGFNVHDIEKVQARADYVKDTVNEAADTMKESIDSSVLGSIYADVAAENSGINAGVKSGTVNLGATGTDGSAAVALDKSNIVDKIVECGQVLDEQKVPAQDRWIVLPSWAITRIKTSELKDASMTGDGTSVLRNGRVGMLDKFTIYSSNFLTETDESGVGCWSIMFGHKKALTFATQLVENDIIKSEKFFGQRMRGLQVYGHKVVRPEGIGHLYAKAA